MNTWDTNHPPDASGECDRCHRDAALWEDHDEPGGWQFCKACYGVLAKKEQAARDRHFSGLRVLSYLERSKP